VVYDLRTKMLKWQQQLDLTTDTTKFKAHIFSSPTLVDVNNDGLLEIVVGTSLGFVYVLDSQVGHPGDEEVTTWVSAAGADMGVWGLYLTTRRLRASVACLLHYRGSGQGRLGWVLPFLDAGGRSM